MEVKPYIIIMAGGIGSRFWPYSRTHKPKQFLDILGIGKSLLQSTYDRFREIAEPGQFLVVTNQIHFEMVLEQLPELKPEQVLTEPLRKNTAACIAYSAYKINTLDPNATLIVTPADHLVLQEQKFIKSIKKAIQAAQPDGNLVTIGIKPNRPETGYGYIQFLESDQPEEALKVKTFTEKPNSKLAKTFLESGDFAWNSGMFVWKVKSLLDAFREHLPDVAEVFEEGKVNFGKETEFEFINHAYTQLKNISIDYGVMEKSDKVFVVLGDFGWSDLGSWRSLHELRDRDEENNVIEANAMLYDTTNSFIKTDSNKLVVIQGLDNFLVNESENVLLICKLDSEKKFREFVTNAKKKGEDFV